MSFSIHLASPAPHFYSPGDIVCGTVSLDAASDATIESIAITFSGASNVAIGPEPGQLAPKPTARRSSYLLFRQQQPLRDAHWCEKGISAWPFQFLLPTHGQWETTAVGLAEPLCQSPWRSLHDVETTVLPPSMRYSSSFTCSIEYVLVARLIRPPHAHVFGREDLAARGTIRVRPGRLSDLPYACMSKKETLLFEHEVPMRSCPALSKSLFVPKTCSDPKAQGGPLDGDLVSISVSIPSILNVRDLAMNRFAFSALSDSTQAVRQEMCVYRYRIELAVYTRVRTETAKQAEVGVIVLAEGSMATQVRQWHANTQGAPNEASSTTHEHAVENEDVAEIQLSVLHKQICDLPPEFASSNIFRPYTLNYALRVQYGSVKASFENRGIPTSIADGKLETAQSLHMLPDIVDMPPSYERTME